MSHDLSSLQFEVYSTEWKDSQVIKVCFLLTNAQYTTNITKWVSPSLIGM